MAMRSNLDVKHLVNCVNCQCRRDRWSTACGHRQPPDIRMHNATRFESRLFHIDRGNEAPWLTGTKNETSAGSR
jgi:hypothetical protein